MDKELQKVYTFLQELYRRNFAFVSVESKFADKIVDLGFQKYTLGGHAPDIDAEIYATIKKARLAKRAWRSSCKKQGLPFEKQEITPWTLFDLSEVNRFLDYGANNLLTIDKLAHKNPHIEFVGLDIVSPKEAGRFVQPERCSYIQVSSQLENLPSIEELGGSPDCINIKLVLHHFESKELLHKLFLYLANIAHSGTTLLLWEETYKELHPNIAQLVSQNNKIGILTNKDLTEEFYNLTHEEKELTLLINDMLLNYANPHMQWTTLYQSWEKWVALCEEYGFNLSTEYNLGIRVNGKLQQGMQIIGKFIKK